MQYLLVDANAVIKMDEKMRIVLERFDIVRMKSRCNLKECNKEPTKEVTIYQVLINRRPKPLVSLYVCDEHVENAEKLVKEFRNIDSKSIFEMKINSLLK